MEDIANQATTILTTYGFSVVGAILILIVGLFFAGRARSLTERGLLRIKDFDLTLARFLASLSKYVVIAVTMIAVLDSFGVETTSLIAVLGAAGLAIGLALQGTLSNVASGVMLLLFRPFTIGDFVEVAGESGTVQAITLFVTELCTPDNVQVIVPNSGVWGSAVKNYNHHPVRRIDLVIGVGYDDDLDKAKSALEDTLKADSRSLAEPEPLIAVKELADSSVNFVVRVWCNSADYWPLTFDLTKAIKERLDRDGIAIPYPQHDIHLVGQAGD